MKKVFLLSKFLADKEDSDIIELRHLKMAVKGLTIVDDVAKKMFRKHLRMRTFKEASYYQNDIDRAALLIPKKNFSEELKAVKKRFEEEGYTLSTKVSVTKKDDNDPWFDEPDRSPEDDAQDAYGAFQTIKDELKNLRKVLTDKIYDQDDAVEAICDNIMASSYHEGEDSPKAIYFFLGPPATGKTYMSQLMQEHMSGFGATKVFDMTQYTHEDSGGGLFGTNRMWGNAAPGALTSFVRENPKSIIVFDEFEKANTKVQGNLLTMLSGGYLNDACGWCSDGKPFTAERKDESICSSIDERVDFTDTIIVFTSNLGKELYTQQSFLEQMKTDPLTAQSMILESISRENKVQDGKDVAAITPEMLSRIGQGQIVLFNKLSLESYKKIAKNQLGMIKEKFEKKFSFKIGYDHLDDLLTALVLSFAPNVDTRRIKTKSHLSVFDKLTDYMLHSDQHFNEVTIDIDEASRELLRSELGSQSEEVKKRYLHNLFRRNETMVYEVAYTEEGSKLLMQLCALKKQKLPKAKDFEGEGALIFDIPEISFDDIAGHSRAKERLNEVIALLKNPEKLKDFDTKPPKGMLLYGPPGTGKTMLAQAFANEADLPFISTTGADLIDSVTYEDGVRIDKMQELFKRAQEYAPSIVFIDEIDSLGSRLNGGSVQTINKLLTSLNGFSDNLEEMVFVIAATNFKERVDSAIIRPGRIGLHVKVDTLDKHARRYFLEKILKKPVAGSFDVERLVMLTAGLTGAELEKVGQESALYVVRHGLDVITQEIIVEQINIIKHGEKLDMDSLEKLMESTAYHEAAHAVLTYKLMPERKIEQITVVPRNKSLGFVSYNMEDDVSNMTKEKVHAMICVTMAGREAQLYKYGEEGVDSGASSDLAQATYYAHRAIAEWGMDDVVGYLNIKGVEAPLLTAQIDTQVQVWLKEGQKRTVELVKMYWDDIERIAKALLKEEMITQERFKEILAL